MKRNSVKKDANTATTTTAEVEPSTAAVETTSSITTPLLPDNSSISTGKSLELTDHDDDDTNNNNNNDSSNNNNSNNNEEENKPTSKLKKLLSILLAPLTDTTGSPSTILPGLFLIFSIGTILGITLPKESSLPTPWYRTFSSIIGYIYFTAWSISFYPQVLLNYRRKSTQGLSIDFCAMNVLGFSCYAVYNISLFWSSYIQKLYKEQHGDDNSIPVRSNDVAFAIHALILSSVTLLQIWYYDGFTKVKMSKLIQFFFLGVFLVLTLSIVVVGVSSKLTWLNYLYLLSLVKVVITLLKYIPQVVLNYQRKSTVGWNIWNIILDFTGGMLSLAQLLGDSADMNDWDAITGNFAKFCLGFVSIFFDIIFFVQHYFLYPNGRAQENESLEQQQENALLQLEEEEEYDYNVLL